MSRPTTESRRISIVTCAMLAVLAVLLVPASQVGATDYHVDQSGNDSTGDGSLSTPWRTIRYALDQLSAGDTLYIHAGTYPAGGDSTDAYTIPTSGSAGNPITITNYQNDQVVISTAQAGFVLSDKDYITFDGLIIDNTTAASCIDAVGNHITIRNCELANGYNAIRCAEATQYTHLLVENCTIHDFGYVPVYVDNMDKVVIKGNTIYNGVANIAAYATTDLVIEDNFCHNTGQRLGPAKMAWSTNGSGVTGAIFRRNVLIDGERYLLGLYSADGMIVYNNVIANLAGDAVEDAMAWLRQDGTSPAPNNKYNVFKNNIYYHMGSDSKPQWWNNALFGMADTIASDWGDQEIDYNCYYKASGTEYIIYGSTWVYENEVSNGWYSGQYDNNSIAGSDPRLVVPSTSAGMEGFAIADDSPCRDAGVALTQANGSGSGTSLTVDDARYFTAGFGLISGDVIDVGGTTAQVTAVNTSTDTLTLDQSISWSNNDPVTLVYYGAAPDIGAVEVDYQSLNDEPVVNAGSDDEITMPVDSVALDGSVSDDGLPVVPGTVSTTWYRLSGPGAVTFDDANAVDTTATFSTDGVYVLRLLADDGDKPGFDDVVITVLGSGAGEANDYHVDQSGSDTGGDGSLSSPWRTIRYGMTRLDAGDTLYIHAGVYPVSGDSTDTYEVNVSGTAGNPVTIRNYQDDFVKIKPDQTVFYVNGRDYITFKGLFLVVPYNKVGFYAYGNHITIDGCTVRGPNIAVKCNSTSTRYTHLHVKDCSMDDFYDIPIFLDNMDKVVIEGNTIWTSRSVCMDPGGVTNLVVQDNFAYNTNKPLGELKLRWGNVEPQSGENNRGAIVRRNIFIDGIKYMLLLASPNGSAVYNNVLAKVDGVSAETAVLYMQQDGTDAPDDACEDNHIKNNILYQTGGSNYLVYVNDDMSEDWDDQDIDYNCYYKSTDTNYIKMGTNTYQGDAARGWNGMYDYNSLFGDDPDFANPTTAAGTAGWVLTAVSPCIDAGTPLTYAIGSGSGSTIDVESAMYFTDGVEIIDGDIIWIGDDTTAQVIGRDLDNNTLTLDKAVAWADGDPVTLPYEGNAPDMGAMEYGFGGGNTPPVVNAGSDSTITLANEATLDGSISDDGLPVSPGVVTTTWTQESGLGTATFGDSSAVDTTVTFSESGIYVLRLNADDGEYVTGDNVTVTVKATTGMFQEEDGTVVMEAEHYHLQDVRQDVAWTEETTLGDYVGDGYMKAGDGSLITWPNGAKLDYDIQFATAGTYRILARRYCVDSTENASNVGIDDVQMSSPRFDGYNGYYDQWKWRGGTQVYITAGSHIFNCVRNEGNWKVDRWVITTHPTWFPSGTEYGPAESPRTGAPIVDAGSDDTVAIQNSVSLDGTVSDDGYPLDPGYVTTTWSKYSGPGNVTFGDSSAVDTTAGFSAVGVYTLRLTADDGELYNYDDVEITVTGAGGNSSPTVNAGSNTSITLPNTVSLDGTVSDDGNPDPPNSVATAWTKQSGPGTVTFGDASAVDTTAGFSENGIYTLRLTADDSELTNYDEVIITVNHLAPTANAGSDDSVTIPNAVTLDGTISDDGYPLNPGAVTVAWTKYSGPGAVTFGDSSAVDTTAGFSVGGTYVLRLTADDGDKTDSDDVTITVNAQNQAPTANAGADDSVVLPTDTYALDGTVSDDGLPATPGAVTTTWTKQSGAGTVTFDDASAVDTTATFSSAGVYVLRLTAHDGALSDYDEVTITVSQNAAPTANAGSDDTITLPSAANLDGTISDDGLPDPPAAVSVTWSKSSGPGTVTFGDANAVDTTAGFSENGVYVLQLLADDGTATDSDTVQITVNHLAPTASAGNDQQITLPNNAALDGTVSDDGFPLSPGSVTTTWSKVSGAGAVTFGDSTAVDTTAGFSSAGTYVLKLEASDGALSDDDTVLITVSEAGTGGAGPFVEEDGTVVMEAENYDNNDTRTDSSGENWTQDTAQAGYVGDGYMYPALMHPNYTSTWSEGSEVGYDIDFTNAGTYYIWLRRYCAGSSANSCHVGVDGTEVGTIFDNSNSGLSPAAWTWLNYPTNTRVYISSGEHTFQVRRREENYRLDRIVLTTDGNYTPSGTGPPESQRSGGAPTNVAPTVDAGANDSITLPSVASLDGTISDDGLPSTPGSVTVTWSKQSGPGAVTFGDANAVDTTAGFSEDGVYVLLLTADDGGLTNSDTVQITVDHLAPTADAGADQVVELPNYATLDGTVSDDGLPTTPGALTTTWTKVSGPGVVTFGDASAVDTTADFSATGGYILRLTADDGDKTDSDDIVITVKQNQAPTVDAGADDSIWITNAATLDGTVSDDGLPSTPGAVTSTWTKQSGPGTVTFGDISAADTTAGFSDVGTYVLRLTADDGGTTNYDEVTISVSSQPTNSAPNVDAGNDDQMTLPTDTLWLDGTVSDDGLPASPGVVTTTWTKQSGPGTVTFGNASAIDTTVGFTEPGAYLLRLTGHDGALSDFDTVQITVNEEPVSGEGPFLEVGGTVVMEGENFDDNLTRTDPTSDHWSVAISTSNYVGDGYAISPYIHPNAYSTWANGCEINYEIDFETAGTYYAWIRRFAVGSSQNSAFIGMDNTAMDAYFDNNNAGINPDQWVWINKKGNSTHDPVYVTTGQHTFQIRRREKDYHVDRIILTTDSGYTPSGTGPAESARSGLFNYAPTANAGSDIEVIMPNDASLDGTVSDDGNPDPPGSVTTTWTKISGPGTVTFGDSSAVDTTASFSELGGYVLRITADDSEKTDYAELTVTVTHLEPTVDAGSDDTVAILNAVSLDGTVSDDGLPGALTTTWTKYSGPGTVTFGDASAVDTTATFSDLGTYVLRLTGNDGDKQDFDDVTITVNHSAPTVNAGSDDTITLGNDAALDGSVSDDGFPASPGAVTTTWSKVSGAGTVTFGDSSAVDTTAGFTEAGTYVLKLEASDGDLSDDDTVLITVNEAGTGGEGPFQEEGGTVVMEAENYDNNDTRTDPTSDNWSSDTSISNYVGDGYMMAPFIHPNQYSTWANGAEVGYDIDFETAGTYYVWLRRYASGSAANSAFVGMDGTVIDDYFDNNNSGLSPAVWIWLSKVSNSPLDPVYVTTGEHTFQIRRREKNYRVDRIILTTDSGYTPSGAGPAESSRQ